MIFDHIGLFVRSLELGREKLAATLPIARWTDPVDDALLKVRVQFGADPAGIRYELVAPFGEGNPVDAVLASGKNILNHVAYRVDSMAAAMATLRDKGSMPLGKPQPAQAFGGKPVVFMLTPLRFILELIGEAP